MQDVYFVSCAKMPVRKGIGAQSRPVHLKVEAVGVSWCYYEDISSCAAIVCTRVLLYASYAMIYITRSEYSLDLSLLSSQLGGGVGDSEGQIVVTKLSAGKRLT